MSEKIALDAAERFLWLNARLIDRLRYLHLFKGGAAEAVLHALRAYQNPDGGFGHALEPDLRGPLSQPAPVASALQVLDETGAGADPMVGRACDFLLSITTEDGGVPFVLASARDFPRAPWWQPSENPPASLVTTPAIAGTLHKLGVAHPWLERATEFCWRRLERFEAQHFYELRGVLIFLDHVPDRERAEVCFERIGPQMLERRLVELDPHAPGEIHGPLDYAPVPGAMARRLFADDLISTHLDALAAAQQEDGGWTVNWQIWTPAAGLEWRGWATVHALTTLRAYGRLP
jgi:Prenyltransferase and squalene oxidase repeat